MGPLPHTGAAVHSNGYTALHWAAVCGNRRIVRSLVDANAAVNAQNCYGCAFSVSASAGAAAEPRRLPCRLTPLHYAAYNGESDTIVELLLRGANGAVLDHNR